MTYYRIESHKGYWLPNAFGYTPNKSEAGVFTLADMGGLNLDGVTLWSVPSEEVTAQPRSALSEKLAATCFLDDDEPVEPPTHITRSKLPPSLHLPECPEKQAELTEQEQLEAQGQQRLIEGLKLDDIITIATHHVRDDDNFRVWCDCGEELHWNDDESLSDCNNCTPP